MKGLWSKLVLGVAGLTLISGCYTFIGIDPPRKERRTYVNFRDYDGDGIPDFYDPHPYHYDLPFFVRPHHYHIIPWYGHQPKIKSFPKVDVKIKERSKEIKNLRNNDGGRKPPKDSGRKR